MIIATLGVALCLTITAFVIFFVKGDVLKKDDSGDVADGGTIIYKPGLTFAPTSNIYVDETEDALHNVSGGDSHSGVRDENVLSPGNNTNSNDGSYNNVGNKTLPDPSGWSKAQIIATARDAVNKTQKYTGSLTVNHSESFTADVTECSAGGIVRSVVDLMIGWVVKPVNETLSYSNGRAVNSEGETVPIILPKKNPFTLSDSGAKSATVRSSGSEYTINIKLVEESVGMYDVPRHNAASIGYLDVAGFDISFMEVDSADIVYKGSSIELKINADGFVTSAEYKIPLHIDGSAHKGSISGSAVFEGEQTEKWILNW